MFWLIHLSFDQSYVWLREELLNNPARLIKIGTRDDNLHGSGPACRCGVGNHPSEKFILKPRNDAFAFQQAFEEIRLDDIAGVNDGEVFVWHSVSFM
jgi:hypothetical protein